MLLWSFSQEAWGVGFTEYSQMHILGVGERYLLIDHTAVLHWNKMPLKCHTCLFCFRADVKNLENFQLVEGVQEQVNAALLDYTMCNYPQQTEKFGQLLLRLPEIRAISMQAEEYLYYKHLNGDVPYNNLLIEMLHAKRA